MAPGRANCGVNCISGDVSTTVPGITAPPSAATVLHDIQVRNSTVRDTPLIGNGTVIPDNGGRDYRGAPLYHGRPDLGAVEGPPAGRA
ncbi:hypothetical protein [Streptomyces sp. MK37H]|uniref:hypothetical protein n=1 Tax=Streptomyces sp. MK37H TaxID=2699117 RepID=UPI001B395C8B|nr:hypothetical protein [Streptomyces sp. MK37H]MBP8534189.1 hypothetical protein [Streptomyces sp. MK37H]